MLVAIINKTSPSGQVKVEEFREAVSTSAAVTAFINEYSPPLEAGDYLGYDPSWGSTYQPTASGKCWYYDFDTPGLVEVLVALNAGILHTNTSGEIAVLSSVTPVAGDCIVVEDDSDSHAKKKVDVSAFIIWSKGHLNGLRAAFVSVTQVSIAAGECQDVDGGGNITNAGTLTATITDSEADGLDTGSEAASTLYALWIIADSTGVNSVASLLSVSSTAPTMPSGYDLKRRVGWVFNNVSSDFTNFIQQGTGRTRTTLYDIGTFSSDFRVITAGKAPTYTVLDLSGFVPSEVAILSLQFETGTSGAAIDSLRVRPDGFSDGPGSGPFEFRVGVVSTTKAKFTARIPCPGQKIEYHVDDTTNNRMHLNVIGFEDEL